MIIKGPPFSQMRVLRSLSLTLSLVALFGGMHEPV